MAEQAEADDVHDEDIEDLEHGEAEDQEDGDLAEGEDAADEDDGDELVVQFGDEAAPASEGERGSNSGLVKELRAKLREASEKAAAYERGDLQPLKPIEVGPKPKIDDFYGEDDPEAAHEAAYDAWNERKRQAEQVQTQAQKQQEAAQAAWQEELAEHGRKVVALGARDFDVAREEVASALNLVQQAALIKAADNSAAVAYALGKNPHKLTELAKIQDPIKFAVAVSKLEGTLKVTKTTRRAVEPDRTVRGSASLAGGDKKLEALEAKAARTGNRTEVIAYKAQLNKQKRK